MKRQTFIKTSLGFLGMAVIAPSLIAKDRNNSGACTAANAETAGPFPTLSPSSLERTNIIGTRTGVPFTINIRVLNVNGCAPLQGVVVDIWHCDKDGYYSQYGGTSMQTVDFTSQDFLRGRQVTDSNGEVQFISIFPGWYMSRATHIHVHIYDANGNSLLVSQIAFPEGTGSAVETVNAATSYGYTKGMTGYTYNSSDNVFSDGTATEMGTIAGSLTDGYTISWDAYCNAGSLGVNQEALNQFQIRQNYPNPCTTYSNVPIILRANSDVQLQILTTDGKIVSQQDLGHLGAGEHTLKLDVAQLPMGKYIYNVIVSNLLGSYNQSKLFVKQ